MTTRTFLRQELAEVWGESELFERVWALQGEVFRDVANRRTLRFEVAGRAYFAKLHDGAGWGEIFKNLTTLRVPVLGARNEYATCLHLAARGVLAPTVAGFGERGRNPARRQSFVICDALEGFESLEDIVADWGSNPPDPVVKRRLVMAVARFARAMHDAGVAHRDFYICHLLLNRRAFSEGKVLLAVIDLHRAQIHRLIPRRWLRKDLAALLFSALDLPLSRVAWLRFVRVYRGVPLQQIFAEEGGFWNSVYVRALALYRKGLTKGLVQGHFRS